LDDLNVVLHSKRLQAIVIPKVQNAKDIQFVSRMIDSVAPESNRSSIRLIASIESAMGIVNLKEIATSDPRLDALIFASEDYCADLGLIRTRNRKEMLYARQAVVTPAAAFALQAIDIVCLDYQNDTILEEESQEGRVFGFAGKQAIHPRQIDIIQRNFVPSKGEIERATRILQSFEENAAKGIGAYALDGKVIDAPVWKWANLIIARARAAGVPIPTASEAEAAAAAESAEKDRVARAA
jgi:citrate lyase subunit beta-like protein